MKLKYCNPFTIWIKPIKSYRQYIPTSDLVWVAHHRIYPFPTENIYIFFREYSDGTLYAFSNMYTIK